MVPIRESLQILRHRQTKSEGTKGFYNINVKKTGIIILQMCWDLNRLNKR